MLITSTKKVLSTLLLLALIPLTYLTVVTDGWQFVAHSTSISSTVIATILMMLAVGIWSAQLGGRALWFVPLTFTGLMVIGTFLSYTHLSLAMANAGILLSVVVMGILICDGTRFSTLVAAGIVGFFALSHGYSYGRVLANSGELEFYLAGIVLTGLILNLSGELSAQFFKQKSSKHIRVRVGGIILFAGIILTMSY
ncbi:MAG: HupE/UreJ family protein [Shewanella sp.]